METTTENEAITKYYDTLREFFQEKIRFNAFLNMSVDHLEQGFARLTIPFVQHLIGDPYRPALHGGVVSTLIDTTGGIAAFTSVRPGDLLSTVDLRVDYLRPAGLRDVIAEGRVMRLGNHVAVCDVVAFQEDKEKPIATGKGVYNIKKTSGEQSQ